MILAVFCNIIHYLSYTSLDLWASTWGVIVCDKYFNKRLYAYNLIMPHYKPLSKYFRKVYHFHLTT